MLRDSTKEVMNDVMRPVIDGTDFPPPAKEMTYDNEQIMTFDNNLPMTY